MPIRMITKIRQRYTDTDDSPNTKQIAQNTNDSPEYERDMPTKKPDIFSVRVGILGVLEGLGK